MSLQELARIQQKISDQVCDQLAESVGWAKVGKRDIEQYLSGGKCLRSADADEDGHFPHDLVGTKELERVQRKADHISGRCREWNLWRQTRLTQAQEAAERAKQVPGWEEWEEHSNGLVRSAEAWTEQGRMWDFVASQLAEVLYQVTKSELAQVTEHQVILDTAKRCNPDSQSMYVPIVNALSVAWVRAQSWAGLTERVIRQIELLCSAIADPDKVAMLREARARLLPEERTMAENVPKRLIKASWAFDAALLKAYTQWAIAQHWIGVVAEEATK